MKNIVTNLLAQTNFQYNIAIQNHKGEVNNIDSKHLCIEVIFSIYVHHIIFHFSVFWNPCRYWSNFQAWREVHYFVNYFWKHQSMYNISIMNKFDHIRSIILSFSPENQTNYSERWTDTWERAKEVQNIKSGKITQGWIPSQHIWEIRGTFSLTATTFVCTSGIELDSMKCLL